MYDTAFTPSQAFDGLSVEGVGRPLFEKIRKIEHGANSGQLAVWIKAVPGAVHSAFQRRESVGEVA